MNDFSNDDALDWPESFSLNAWTGDGSASSSVPSSAKPWARGARVETIKKKLFPPPAPGLENWDHPEVGWGLILPFRADLSREQRASAVDAPEPIRALLKERGDAPVFRYHTGKDFHLTHLRKDASNKDVPIAGAPRGLGANALPYYLLIYGSPLEIPWELQYVLNATCAVGRLDLQGQALENYVSALLNDWKGSNSQLTHQVVWSVDHRTGDITTLMRDAIGAQVHEALAADGDFEVEFVDGTTTRATGASLTGALARHRPSLVVTTSHGMTGPLSDLEAMRAKLGLLVDHSGKTLAPDDLLKEWEPDGAVWYAHACCSAGSTAITRFTGLVEAGSTADRVLKGVAKLGSLTAPLPMALLGAKKPLRAFVGHVEPTFDWTIRQRLTGQFLTTNVKKALYDNLYSQAPHKPVGFAFRDYYEPIGPLRAQYDNSRTEFINTAKESKLKSLLYCQLMAADLQSMVILGDPAVRLPGPGGG